MQFPFGLAGIFLARWNARRFGKRKALLAVLVLGAIAYGSSWWVLVPGVAWTLLVNSALTIVATTGLWVLAPSMTMDVIDNAELHSGQRREGAFNSWLSWSVKISLALSGLASGLILEATGFRASLGAGQPPAAIWWIRVLLVAIPSAAALGGIVLLVFYPLSQRRVQALRLALESKRGQV